MQRISYHPRTRRSLGGILMLAFTLAVASPFMLASAAQSAGEKIPVVRTAPAQYMHHYNYRNRYHYNYGYQRHYYYRNHHRYYYYYHPRYPQYRYYRYYHNHHYYYRRY